MWKSETASKKDRSDGFYTSSGRRRNFFDLWTMFHIGKQTPNPPCFLDASFVQLLVLNADGQVERTNVIKKSSWNNVWGGGRIETSINGCCFATAVSSTSRFWEELDFYPSHAKLYVWKYKDLEPDLSTKTNGFRSDFRFLPDGSQIVILDG
jgi:hypothetical protein